MDSGAVTPVITAEPTGGKAHLTKQQPGERWPAQTEHVYQNHRRGKSSYFVFLKQLTHRVTQTHNAVSPDGSERNAASSR